MDTRSPLRGICALMAISLALAGTGHAADTLEVLRSRQQAIRAGIQAGTAPYADLTDRQKRMIGEDQRALSILLEGTDDLDALAAGDRRRVDKLVSRIDRVLQEAQGQKLVCTQEMRTGSNYLTRVCRTAEQIKQEKQSGDKLLRDEANRIKCNERIGCG